MFHNDFVLSHANLATLPSSSLDGLSHILCNLEPRLLGWRVSHTKTKRLKDTLGCSAVAQAANM